MDANSGRRSTVSGKDPFHVQGALQHARARSSSPWHCQRDYVGSEDPDGYGLVLYCVVKVGRQQCPHSFQTGLCSCFSDLL